MKRWSDADRKLAEALKEAGVSQVCKLRNVSGEVMTFWRKGDELGGLPRGVFCDLGSGESITLDEIVGEKDGNDQRVSGAARSSGTKEAI